MQVAAATTLMSGCYHCPKRRVVQSQSRDCNPRATHAPPARGLHADSCDCCCTPYRAHAIFTTHCSPLAARPSPSSNPTAARSVEKQVQNYQHKKRHAQQPREKILAHDVHLFRLNRRRRSMRVVRLASKRAKGVPINRAADEPTSPGRTGSVWRADAGRVRRFAPG